MVVCMTSWHAHLKCTESSYEHGEEVLHRAYGAGSGRQNQSNGSHRKANQIGAGDASTARGELIRPKQAAAPNTTAPEIAALVLQRRFISWPNTKDQTPYLVIRRCNTRSLAGKPLAGLCATRSRRIQDLYGMVVHVIRSTPTMPSIIDVKKTPAWGESRFPARLLVLQRRFIWQGDFWDRFEPDPYCHERTAISRSWPNTKDQTPYLVIRRCNTR